MPTSGARSPLPDAEAPGPDRRLAFYGLVSPPFRTGPDPGRLWLGNAHRVILETLTRAIRDDSGVALLTGDAGTGKTSLAQRLIAMLGPAGIAVGRVSSPGSVPSDFFEAVLSAHGVRRPVHDSETFLACFRDILARAAAVGDKVLLVVDEAQGLSHELLAEVGCVSGMAAAASYPLVILLVGETRLTAALQDDRHAALRERIIARCAVPPLGPDEVATYVRHYLDAAGAVTEIFSPEALRAIASLSRGAPGAINIIGDRALLVGRAARARPITETIVMNCGRSPGSPSAPLADLDRTPRAEARRARPPGRSRLYLTIATSVLFVTGAPYLAWWLTGLGDHAARTSSDTASPPSRDVRVPGEESPAPAVAASPRAESSSSTPSSGEADRVQLPERRGPMSAAPIEAQAAVPVTPVPTRPRIEVPRESAASEERRLTREMKPPAPTARKPVATPEASVPAARTPDNRADGPDPSAIIDWLMKESPGRR